VSWYDKSIPIAEQRYVNAAEYCGSRRALPRLIADGRLTATEWDAGTRSGAVVEPPMFPISSQHVVSFANIHKGVPTRHENGPRSDLWGPFLLVAGTGFEPATSGL
jgi:hypothetical protein